MTNNHISFRVTPEEEAALNKIISQQKTLVNRTQYIKAALNSYSKRAIFR